MSELVVPEDAQESYNEWVRQQVQQESKKICTRQNDECNSRTGQVCDAKVLCEENGRPWICRGCEKIPASCGKSASECEYSLWKANEYERS